MWPYDHDSEPPAPFLEVVVHHPERSNITRSIRAKLDTGADVSAIPASLVEELDLLPESQLVVEGYDLHLVTLPTYYVALVVIQVPLQRLEVITFPEKYICRWSSCAIYFESLSSKVKKEDEMSVSVAQMSKDELKEITHSRPSRTGGFR